LFGYVLTTYNEDLMTMMCRSESTATLVCRRTAQR